MFATQTKSKTKESAEERPPRIDTAHGGKDALKQNSLWQSLALNARALQPKLAVSQPDDPYEQEADRVADLVMRTTGPRALLPEKPAPSDNKARIQGKFTDKPLTKLLGSSAVIQRKPDPKPVPGSGSV